MEPDWNSSDGSKVNVGSGGVASDISYGGDALSATGGSSLRADGNDQPSGEVGRQGYDNLSGLPEDAKKN